MEALCLRMAVNTCGDGHLRVSFRPSNMGTFVSIHLHQELTPVCQLSPLPRMVLSRQEEARVFRQTVASSAMAKVDLYNCKVPLTTTLMSTLPAYA
jgi:hypothetical protein